MKASDYLVEYLIEKGINDIFGYPGGMVTDIIDSLSKYSNKITAHITYHEQGAAFAACGYAQANNNVGVAYATSGPGATNLITGICNAYFDSIPVVFISGQVNTFESKGDLRLRQRGFQETDVVSLVASVTKYAAQITEADMLKWHLDHAFAKALSDRKGPVLLDIPMNIMKAEINPDKLKGYAECDSVFDEKEKLFDRLTSFLQESKRPVLLVGNGIKTAGEVNRMRNIAEHLQIPVVSTMLGIDIVVDSDLNYGFIGAYGHRVSNFIAEKSDLIISIGARLDVRQVGANREAFAPNAKLLRIDIDDKELEYKVHEDETQVRLDINSALDVFEKVVSSINACGEKYLNWRGICDIMRNTLQGIDDYKPNRIIEEISEYLPDDASIVTDVGQNQVWVAQSLKLKRRQKVFFSGGLGAMGYSLPAAIGISLAKGGIVYSFNGDGGIQMNIQEFQTVAREKLPIKIIIINNFALGLLRHFQEMYFANNYYQTVPDGGYTVPDFKKIAGAYGLEYFSVVGGEKMNRDIFRGESPAVIEIFIDEPTYVFPKLKFGHPNNDQEPLLDRNIFEYLNSL